MSVSPATAHRTTPARTGPPSLEDREARTPLGRWLHQQEGRVYSMARTCLRGHAARPVFLSTDSMADESVRANEAAARELLTHEDPVVQAWALRILGNCADYWRADQMEDACVLGLFGLFVEIHGCARQFGGALERLAVALRGRR